jgi:carboxymethylenebutenolidase
MIGDEATEGIMSERIQIPTQGMQCIGAWRAQPLQPSAGGVVVVQEIFGVNSHIRSVVDRLASHGFTAIAPAVFDHVETDVELDYDQAGVDRGRQLAADVGFDRAVAAVASAAEAIASAGPIAVIGFCWGGTVAFLANTRLGLPAVSYYGGRTVPFLHERPQAPLLMHFGEYDPIIPPEDVARHRQALPEARIHVYPAGHGFNCDQRSDHDTVCAALAWQRSHDFLREVLAS